MIIFPIRQDKCLHSQNVLEFDAILAPDCHLQQKTDTEDDKFLTSLCQIYDNFSDYVAGLNLYLLGEQGWGGGGGRGVGARGGGGGYNKAMLKGGGHKRF